jgi:uncharacterized protein YegJ (DUF2314 family)
MRQSLRAFAKTFSVAGLVLLIGLIGLAAAAPKAGEPVPAGDIRHERGFYSVVFYFVPEPAVETFATAQALAKRLLPDVAFLTNQTNKVTPPFLGFEEEKTPLKDFPVPSALSLNYSGRGLTETGIASFQKTSRATRLILVAPKAQVWSLGRKFTELVQEFADTTKAYVWDSATRECFSREAWRTNRLARWSETGIPDLTKQFTIHLYRIDEKSLYLRAITLGMEKFALPDVVIERLIGSDNRPGGNLINLVCQSLAEQPVISDGRKTVFRTGDLQAGSLRTNLESFPEKGATHEITLALLRGRPQEGDPGNSLIKISFESGVGKTEDERRENLLSRLWGSRDSIVGVKHTGDIVEASKRARAKLADLRASFIKGLPPGSRLLVKAPFARDDEGNEWMWVEVMRWPSAANIDGILQNDPFYIRKLKAGSRVPVNVSEIFDYIFYRGDGSREGNETGKLMEKQAGQTKRK